MVLDDKIYLALAREVIEDVRDFFAECTTVKLTGYPDQVAPYILEIKNTSTNKTYKLFGKDISEETRGSLAVFPLSEVLKKCNISTERAEAALTYYQKLSGCQLL